MAAIHHFQSYCDLCESITWHRNCRMCNSIVCNANVRCDKYCALASCSQECAYKFYEQTSQYITDENLKKEMHVNKYTWLIIDQIDKYSAVSLENTKRRNYVKIFVTKHLIPDLANIVSNYYN